jgi:hypothetical protein
MSAVHEEVHQRAEEERQVDEDAQHVSLVLSEEQDSGNDQEAEQNKPRSWRQEASARLHLLLCVFTHGHGTLLPTLADVVLRSSVAGRDQPSIRELAGSI